MTLDCNCPCVCALCGSYSELVFHCVPNAQHGLAPKTALSRAQLQTLLSQYHRHHGCLCLMASSSSAVLTGLLLPGKPPVGEGIFSISCLLSRGFSAQHLTSHLTPNIAETHSQSPLPASVMGPISPAGGLCPHQQLLCLTCQPSFHVTHTPTESSHWCGSEAALRAGRARWRWSR